MKVVKFLTLIFSSCQGVYCTARLQIYSKRIVSAAYTTFNISSIIFLTPILLIMRQIFGLRCLVLYWQEFVDPKFRLLSSCLQISRSTAVALEVAKVTSLKNN